LRRADLVGLAAHYSPAILPIPGTTSIEHLRQNLAAQDVELTPHQFEEIAELTI
jgi:aryl-alcohol dehydrogenase-like predicted oxidoreductase